MEYKFEMLVFKLRDGLQGSEALVTDRANVLAADGWRVNSMAQSNPGSISVMFERDKI